MTVEFFADGTVTVTSGTVRTSRWSVDRTGRLTGGLRNGSAEAWVTGEGLTIMSESGRALTFRRVPGQ